MEDLCEEFVDCKNRTAPLDEGGEFFAVGTPAMRSNRISFGEARPISRSTYELWTARLVPREGDLLLAREAPVGPVVLVPRAPRVAAGQRTVLLRVDPAVAVAKCLYYYLIDSGTQQRLQGLAHGSTVPHLRLSDVRDFEVDLPDLATQTAIADVLGALDDKIAANERANSIASALSQSLLVRASDSVPLVPLGQLVDVPRNTVTPVPGGVWHFSLPAFDEGEVPKMEDGAEIKSAKQRLDQPAVLLSKLNPRIPRVWDVASIPEAHPALASTEFIVLEPRSASTAVLAAALRLPTSLDGLQSLARGTSGSHQRVSPADAMALEIPDVRQLPVDLREKLAVLAAATASRRTESARLAATRDALLPELMSGRLAVKNI
nr:restriction endonuclease subunit S [Tessaracoccus sp. MC1627]